MKYFVVLLLIISPFTDLDKIAKVNKAKKEAKEAYLEGNYRLAHDTYKLLIDSLGVKEDEVLLDFAHTQYHLNDTTNAVNSYQQLAQSSNTNIASIAEQQLGQVLFDKKQYEPALEHYKNALRKNPSNQDARYNYELLKKLIQEQKDQQDQNQQNQDQQNKDQQDQDKQDQNKDQQNKDEQNKDQENKDQQDKQDQQKQDEQQQKDQEQQQKDQEKKEGQEDEKKDQKQEQQDQQQKEGEKSEQGKKEQPQPTPSDKLKDMNISEEKAKMILEAMKNNEIQYIQQNRRKASKKKDSGKPDW